MPLSWNEIRNRVFVFATEWRDETSEQAEAKSFWDAFFNVFGISRRRVASFERHVKKGDGRTGFRIRSYFKFVCGFTSAGVFFQ